MGLFLAPGKSTHTEAYICHFACAPDFLTLFWSPVNTTVMKMRQSAARLLARGHTWDQAVGTRSKPVAVWNKLSRGQQAACKKREEEAWRHDKPTLGIKNPLVDYTWRQLSVAAWPRLRSRSTPVLLRPNM